MTKRIILGPHQRMVSCMGTQRMINVPAEDFDILDKSGIDFSKKVMITIKIEEIKESKDF